MASFDMIVVKVHLDIREWCSCTSNYWKIALLSFQVHKNALEH